ncbi:MAG: hypothetical protein JXD23_05115 [Spirochaetales bacterium]|nr:hypothetical protein [Spirochaetales bacterium]
MILLFIAVFFIAFIFFGLIPGFGAFLIRGQWYRFRQKLTQSSQLSVADISLLSSSSAGGQVGHFRFFGSLESIQGRNRLWVTDKNFTVGVDVEKVSVSLLRSYPIDERSATVEFSEDVPPDEEPDYLPWKKIYSLPSGIQVFVSGPAVVEDGQLIFRPHEKDSLLLIIYDGARESLLKRCIWSARQKNEYYNPFTTVSLILGALVLLLIAFLSALNQELVSFSLFSLTLATFPVVYLFPPGVFLYFLYRFFWKRSRLLRSQRDLLLLPLRYFPPETDLAAECTSAPLRNGEEYVAVRWQPGNERALFALNPQMRIRGNPLPGRSDEEGVYYIFGVRDGKEIQTSTDPMVELVCLPGNPRRLADACARKSRELGLVSAVCIFSGLLVNFTLIYLILLFTARII